jgi:hypothetical protein
VNFDKDRQHSLSRQTTTFRLRFFTEFLKKLQIAIERFTGVDSQEKLVSQNL